MARGRNEKKVKLSVLLIIILLLMGGSAAGACLEKGMDAGERENAEGYLNRVLSCSPENPGAGGADVFREALKSNLLMLAVMGVGCVSVVLF
ncbi:MAG: hypothetical protein Q4C14_03730, partial [Bacillota bacterium]|nr:hypothetical protein [Bacillota bacterium]